MDNNRNDKERTEDRDKCGRERKKEEQAVRKITLKEKNRRERQEEKCK